MRDRTDYNKKYRRSPTGRYKKAISKALEKNKSFKLSFDEFTAEVNKPCFYCSDALRDDTGAGIGLDRLDSELGYELGNVVSCCQICNMIKHNKLTIEETKAAVKAVIKVRDKKITK